MYRRLRAFGLLLCLALVTTAAGRERPIDPPPARRPAELKRLHVLLVFDTDSNLKEQLEHDRAALRSLLRKHVPASRLTLTVLDGKAVRRGEILRYYRNLETGPDEGLLFFYGGHGATDADKGHFLALQEGTPGQELYRADLRRAMRATRAGLVVLLTDCCSTPHRIPPVPGSEAFPPKKKEDEVQLHPMLRCLFFQARGLVDINAATDEASWGDNLQGGLFTGVLTRLLLASRDPERDRLATWPAFFARLRHETETGFTTWAVEMRARGARIDAKSQTPYAWFLGPNTAVDNAARHYAVVRLNNRRSKSVFYSYRWQGEAEWQRQRLEPNADALHVLPLTGADDAAPVLEVGLQRAAAEHRLRPRRFEGERQPSRADAALYRITEPAPASSPAASPKSKE